MKKIFLCALPVLLGAPFVAAVVWNNDIDNAAQAIFGNGGSKTYRMRMAVDAFRGLKTAFAQYPLDFYAQQIEQDLNLYGGLLAVPAFQSDRMHCVDVNDFAKLVSVFHSYNALLAP